MANLKGFDANEWEPNMGFEPIPAGQYPAVIVASEWKDTKAGDGKYLNLELQIIGSSKFEGRKLFDRLNLDNPNDQAVSIAKGTLSAICRAVGVMVPKDSSELHNKPLVVRVSVEVRADNGEPANRVKGYKPIADQPSSEPVVNSGKSSVKPPWEK